MRNVKLRRERAGALLGILLVLAVGLAAPAAADHAAGEAAGPIGLAPPPEPTVPPTITGTARVGSTLTADDGKWEGTPTLGHYWLRCDALGANCVFIHSTAPTYTLTDADLGKTIRLRVLATISTGAREVESAPTAVVQAALPPPQPAPAASGRPRMLVAPSLKGELREGSRLGVVSGVWSGLEPIAFALAWERCDERRCVATGTTGPAHVLGAADVGKRMRARVTASNSVGATSAYSDQSAIVEPRQAVPERMKPFPRIQISGFILRGGVRLRRLAVRAPPGSTVRVSCHGRSCPYRSGGGRMRSDLLVIRRMRGRFLRAGTIIEMRVTGAGRIGKYTRFRIRRGAKPARVDLCLVPRQRRPSRCA